MQFLLLIYESESMDAARSEAEGRAFIGEYIEFTGSIKAAGKMIAGDALQPVETATTVRVRDGRTVVTDGPFAETKEQLGGYYLVNANDLDEALSMAARIPSARTGSIEVRPIKVYGG